MATLSLTTPAVHAAEDLVRQETGLLNEALDAYDRASKLRQANPSEANRLYREAAAKYDAIIAAGVHNGRLWYNLGNARLQLGEIGRAIIAYRRAERLIPADARLQANLRFARSLRRNRIAPTGQRALLHTVFFWHYDTPMHWRFRTATVAYLLFWLGLIGRWYARRLRLGIALGCLGLLWVALGTSVAQEHFIEGRRAFGVITAADVVVRKGPGEAYDPQFKQNLHDGVEFEVIETRRDWWHVRLPDDQHGWLRSRAGELI